MNLLEIGQHPGQIFELHLMRYLNNNVFILVSDRPDNDAEEQEFLQ